MKPFFFLETRDSIIKLKSEFGGFPSLKRAEVFNTSLLRPAALSL